MIRTLYRRLRTALRILCGRELLVLPDCNASAIRIGSEGGGWFILEGPLCAEAVVYSFGVGEDVSFDTGLIERFGVTVHAFDPTPKSIRWLKKQRLSSKLVLHEFGVAAVDGDATFYEPLDPDHVSHSMVHKARPADAGITVPVKRVSTIMATLGHTGIDVLKMDIEGAEYEVIEDMLKSGVHPNQILVEFHHRFPGIELQKTKIALRELRSAGYKLYAVSASNEEYCFVFDAANSGRRGKKPAQQK